MLGFKFVLPNKFPAQAPLAYLDEPENAEVVEMIDYLDVTNRIMFDYLIYWERENSASTVPNAEKFNLKTLLLKIYKLFLQMPPLSIDELFGAPPQQ